MRSVVAGSTRAGPQAGGKLPESVGGDVHMPHELPPSQHLADEALLALQRDIGSLDILDHPRREQAVEVQ